jgi:biopolymer transport protein ExbD
VKGVANIDILPMAAVGLIMVLIMMVVSPLVVTKNSTPVDVPMTHTSERKVENDINITYASDGQLLIDDKPMANYEELQNTLQALVMRDPYVLVVVRADKNCLHSNVLDVLACVRRAGALRIACATKRYKEG